MALAARRINSALFFLLVLSCFMQRFYVEVGFALKPFIVVSVGALIVSLWVNGYTNMTCLYERLFAGFVATSVLRGAVSLDTNRYFRSTLALLVVMLYYLAVSQVVARVPNHALFRVFFLAGVLFLTLSLALFWLAPEIGALTDRGVVRLRGTTIDPNIFVAFALPIFAWSLAQLLNGQFLGVLILMLTTLCSALTLSRGGAVALGTTSLLVLWKMVREGRRVSSLLGLSCAVLLAALLVHTGAIPWLEFMTRSGLEDGSGRLAIWRNGLKLFSANPWFGIGLDNFRAYNYRFFHHWQYMHNTYLEVLIENGLVGFAFFATSIAALLLHKSKGVGAGWVKIALMGQLTAVFFLSGLTLEPLFLVAGMYKGLSLQERIHEQNDLP